MFENYLGPRARALSGKVAVGRETVAKPKREKLGRRVGAIALVTTEKSRTTFSEHSRTRRLVNNFYFFFLALSESFRSCERVRARVELSWSVQVEEVFLLKPRLSFFLLARTGVAVNREIGEKFVRLGEGIFERT